MGAQEQKELDEIERHRKVMPNLFRKVPEEEAAQVFERMHQYEAVKTKRLEAARTRKNEEWDVLARGPAPRSEEDSEKADRCHQLYELGVKRSEDHADAAQEALLQDLRKLKEDNIH